jgi:hypothetical protein
MKNEIRLMQKISTTLMSKRRMRKFSTSRRKNEISGARWQAHGNLHEAGLEVVKQPANFFQMVRRRKSPGTSKKWIVLVIVAFALAFIVQFSFRSKEKDSFRTLPSLDVRSYLENANTLRGNIYKVEGNVTDLLAWSPESGRLIAIQVGDEIIPVLVTEEFKGMNIQKEQKLLFIVDVDEKGILRTRKVNKA